MLLASSVWKLVMLLNIVQCLGKPLMAKNYLAENINNANTEKPWPLVIYVEGFMNYSAPLIIIIMREEHVLWHLNEVFPRDQNSFLLFLFFISIHDETLGTSNVFAISYKGEDIKVSALHTVGSL